MSIPVPFHPAIDAVQHHVVPEVKLPSFVKQRSLYVLLQDVGLIGAITVGLLGLEDTFDFI